MVYLQYERIIRFHHEPGKGHYIIYFTLNERAVVLGAVCYRRGQSRKSMTCQEIIYQSRHLLLSGGAVRRNSLRCAPFGPPTVSCVLAPARTCLRQAPPTSRGRGLATSAVLYHLTDDMSIYTIFLGNTIKCFIFAFAYVFTHPR